MSMRYKGGIISSTPPVITAPVGGEGGAASGIWSLSTVLEEESNRNWPKAALLTEAWSWGSNTNGQLGDLSTTVRSSPVQAGSATDWKQITGGVDHTIGVKKDGTLWAWGSNNQGRLGLGDTVNRSSPVQIGALTTWDNARASQETSHGINRWHSLGVGQIKQRTTRRRHHYS